MMPITHVCGALALAGANLGPNPVLLGAAVVGAVLPDLDELQSPMGWRVGQWLSHPRFGIGRQRTYLLCFSLGGVVVGWLVGCPFDLLASWWIGWASHMLLDMCSGGVASWRVAGLADYVLLCMTGSLLILVAVEDHWIPAWGEMLKHMVIEGGR